MSKLFAIHRYLKSTSQDQLQAEMFEWLTYRASLCEKLQQRAGNYLFTVILKEWMGNVYLRVVSIHPPGKPGWLGLSYIPRATLAKPEAQFLQQDSRPIGQWLFSNDSPIQRYTLESVYYRIPSGLPLLQPLFEQHQTDTAEGYGRRSIYAIAGAPFFLVELFHPNFFKGVAR